MDDEQAIRSAAAQLGVVLVNDHAVWMQQLIISINQLLVHDFNKLIAILYRLDVSETRLREHLAASPASDAAAVIAVLVVERQVQKIKSRQESQRNDISSISEEDRW